MQLLIDTVYSRNRLIIKNDTSNSCFENIQLKIKCYSILITITVKQYFAFCDKIGKPNHVILLLQWNNIALYVIIYIELLPNILLCGFFVSSPLQLQILVKKIYTWRQLQMKNLFTCKSNHLMSDILTDYVSSKNSKLYLTHTCTVQRIFWRDDILAKS